MVDVVSAFLTIPDVIGNYYLKEQDVKIADQKVKAAQLGNTRPSANPAAIQLRSVMSLRLWPTRGYAFRSPDFHTANGHRGASSYPRLTRVDVETPVSSETDQGNAKALRQIHRQR